MAYYLVIIVGLFSSRRTHLCNHDGTRRADWECGCVLQLSAVLLARQNQNDATPRCPGPFGLERLVAELKLRIFHVTPQLAVSLGLGQGFSFLFSHSPLFIQSICQSMTAERKHY
jgi:hypothetical protein